LTTSDLEFVFVMLSFTALIILYCYVDEIVMGPVQDGGKKNVTNYFIDASGGRGGTFGGGRGGGNVHVGDRYGGSHGFRRH
jgi:hypothetical protein